jgi:hypothetical protein
LGEVYVQYIADTLIGHPHSQAFIANDGAIVNKINASNIQVQFINALHNNLNTNTFSVSDICTSILLQLKDNIPERFVNELDDTEYPLPFCPKDNVSLFVRMKCNVNLDNTVGGNYSNDSQYTMLKTMFENRPHVEFNDITKEMKLTEKVWRIKVKLS